MDVIAIAGMPGAGSSSVGKKLATELEMNFFSMGQLFKDIAKGEIKNKPYYSIFANLCAKKGVVIPDMHASGDSDAVKKMWDSEVGKSKSFHEVIDRLQIELSKRGNIVIDGKLSLRMIENATWRIWIKADIEDRAKRIAERDKIDVETAKEIIVEREKKEREEWKKIYKFDYFDQEKDADIVVDSSTTNVSDIVDEIIESHINVDKE